MNVLLTSVGRRSYLVRYFQQALQGRGIVVATNCHARAPGLRAADRAFIVPPSSDPGYGDAIADLCRRFDIGLLCSCHDLDTLALAQERDRLHRQGVAAMLPNPEWARICLDKYACTERLKESGFDVPWAALSPEEATSALRNGEVEFPLVIKARLGFGALELNQCRDMSELKWLHRRATENLRGSILDGVLGIPSESAVLIQEYIAGPELCVDVVNDLDGRYAAHFVTEVHAMRAGESDWATTVDPSVLGDLPNRLARLTRHAGIWGVDLMAGDGRLAIIDINPRFTGDYPFSHLAGADIPAALLAWAEGTAPDPGWLEAAVGVTGYKDLAPTRDAGSTTFPATAPRRSCTD